jgi:hypothetical protein
MTLRSLAVQVDRDIRWLAAPGGRCELLGGDLPVDPAGELHERTQRFWGGQQHVVRRKGRSQRTVGGHGRQEVAEAQRSIDQDPRPAHGHDASSEEVTTSSRSSQPAGWVSATSTA